MTTEILTHPFDHLAPGPYRFVGIRDASEIASNMAMIDSPYDRPKEGSCIGSCHHCNAAITIGVAFKGSNGVKFVVGETCAKKAFEPGSVALSEAKKACNNRRTKNRNAKISDEFDLAVRWMASVNLADRPHPKSFQGLSLLDYLIWFKANAGKKKFIDVCKLNGFA